jgi:hypothetical protein
VHPNPKESVSFGRIRIKKKSSDTDTNSDPDTVVKKVFCEKLQIKHLKEKKKNVFLLENFFLCRTGTGSRGIHMKAMKVTILKNFGSKY